MYNPPFQSVYMVNELPKDDMYCIAKQDVYQNKCNVHQFVNKGSQPQYEFTSNPLAAAAAAAASRFELAFFHRTCSFHLVRTQNNNNNNKINNK